jgi:uncharacterized protein
MTAGFGPGNGADIPMSMKSKQVKGLKWDLLLAGHTHGGQFYFPFIGTPFAPVNDRKFVNGVFEYEKGKMYVSPGVGNLHGVRINCRPEISVLELKR